MNKLSNMFNTEKVNFMTTVDKRNKNINYLEKDPEYLHKIYLSNYLIFQAFIKYIKLGLNKNDFLALYWLYCIKKLINTDRPS